MRACLAFNAAEAAAKAAAAAVADALVVAPLVAALRVFAFFFLRCRFRGMLDARLLQPLPSPAQALPGHRY